MTSLTDLFEKSAEEEEESPEQEVGLLEQGEEPLEQQEGSLEEDEKSLEEEAPRPLLKVASRSVPQRVAGAIAGTIREGKPAELQAIGPHAVNQAIKAVIIARRYLAEEDIDVICVPEFIEVMIGDLERTAVKFTVEPR